MTHPTIHCKKLRPKVMIRHYLGGDAGNGFPAACVRTYASVEALESLARFGWSQERDDNPCGGRHGRGDQRLLREDGGLRSMKRRDPVDRNERRSRAVDMAAISLHALTRHQYQRSK